MGSKKTDDSGSDVAKGLLMLIAFFAVAWPYFLGTWLAVKFGAENPSTARALTGWVFEGLWVGAMAAVAIGVWHMKKRDEEEAHQLELSKVRREVEFGSYGLRLYQEAEASVADIAASEAARAGWLGNPADFDFRADMEAMADNLRRAQKIRAVTAEASSIKNFTESDKQMLKDAKREIARLEDSVEERVKLIGECAQQANDIDRVLHEAREDVEMSKRRDELRDRLGPIVYGSESRPADTHSESADVVTARAAAFHDLKALIDKHRIEGIDD